MSNSVIYYTTILHLISLIYKHVHTGMVLVPYGFLPKGTTNATMRQISMSLNLCIIRDNAVVVSVIFGLCFRFGIDVNLF